MKLFLDMDGVLADFTTGLTRALGVPYNYPADPYPFREGVWDYFPEIERRYGKTFYDCNAACSHQFWRRLPWMHDGRDILRVVLEHFDEKDVYLLTSPMPHVESPSGKWHWVCENIPSFKKRTIITNVDKGVFASEDAILIDDCDKNVESFADAGSRAIPCPRPWNVARHYADEASLYIDRALEVEV